MKISTISKLSSINFKTTLKSFLFLMVLLIFIGGITQAQTKLAAWSFEDNSTSTISAANLGINAASANIYADGTNGSSNWTATELDKFAGSTINDPKASPSNSYTLTAVYITGEFTNGKSWVIKLPTTGYENPILTYATRGTASGFKTHTWSYSTDGASFTDIKTISGRNVTSFSLQTVDFSAANVLDNAAYIYLKVTFDGATSGAGNNRLDNVVINATEAAAANAPTVTPGSITGAIGTPLTYSIIASDAPTSYAISSGTLPAGLSLNTSTGVISGTPNAAAFTTFSVTATNAIGTSSPEDFDITIDKGDQTITFNAIPNATYGDGSITLTATSTSGLPISYSTSNSFVASVSGNILTIFKAGTIDIYADQEGNDDYNPASTVIVSLTINKADQEITFGALADKTSDDPDFTLTASSTSGLPITYMSSDPAVITISGTTAQIIARGNAMITASQAGNVNYNPAVSVDQNQYISNAALEDQTITFNALSDATYGTAPFALTGTASSGLAITYTSSNVSVATISGSTITIEGVGSTTITASQDGDGTYNPAADVTQDLNVLAKNLTISGIIANDKMYDGTTSSNLDVSGASLVGVVGSDVVTYSGTGTFANANVANGIVITTNYTLSGADAGNYTLTQPTLSANILKANQTITFGSLPGKFTTDPAFALSGTSTSGLTVTYASSNTSVATISGNTVTIVGAGTTSITASQAGNANYNAAADVSNNLTVTVPPTPVTWNMGTSSGNPSPSSGVPISNLTVSDISAGNNLRTADNNILILTTSSASSGYSGVSGAYNAGTTASTGSVNTSSTAYFEFTLTPTSGYGVSFNSLSVGSRSTGTGPTVLSLRTSKDGFAANVASVTPSAGTSWKLNTFSFSAIQQAGPLTIRIYGSNGVGSVTSSSANNWRIDDISLLASATAPTTPPTVTAGSFSGVVGTALSYNIAASNAPTSYAITSGTLPAGLTLNTTTGEISGTPTAVVSSTIVVTATNASGTSAPADIDITINKGNQTITFNALPNATFGDGPITLSATSTSGLAITYSSSDPLIASVSGSTITILKAGSVDITASQAGNANYNAATPVTVNLTINKADQTITFAPLADKASDDADFTLVATSTSGLPVTFASSDAGVITISGTTASIAGPGNTTITASQAGNDNYNAATSVDQNQFVTNAALTDQTITFNALADVTYGASPITLSATATSGLPVSYTSSDESVATVSGNTLTIVGAGTTIITANQDGNGTYNPAPDVTQELVVLPKDLTLTGIVANDKMYDGTTDVTINLTGASLNGVVGADDVTYSGTPAFADANAATGVAVVTNYVLTGADAANYTLTQPILSANILKANQTIMFAALANSTTNDAPFELTATSTSGLAVTYTSSDPLVATVSGTTVTIVGAGTTIITASQSGDLNYNAAADVSQNLNVIVAPVTVMWNFGTTTANASPSSGAPVAHLIISDFSQGNNANTSQTSIQINTTSSSASSGFSGQYNASITAENVTFDLGTSAYFEFTLSPVVGYKVTLNDLSFASRSTSSGPTTLSIRTSKDNFATDAASLEVLAGTTGTVYVLREPSISPIESVEPLVVRIYGSVTGGTGSVNSASANNFRIDDVSVDLIVEELPSCSGTPTAGTASAETSVFCLSGSTNINLVGNTSPEETQGITLQWYSSTNNVDFAPVINAASETLFTGTITQTTYYYNVVSCSVSGLSATSNTVTVLISDLPSAEITGNLSFCTGGTTTLTSSPGSTYDWKLDGNSFASTQSVTVSTAGNYTVTVTNANSCSATSSAFVVSEIPAPTAPVISGIVNVCTYIGTGQQLTYTLIPIQGATSYNWIVPPAATIVSGQGTSTITITLRSDYAAFVNKQIRAVAVTACGVGPYGIFYTSAQSPVTPRPITGPTDVCPYFNNSLEATYSIEAVDAASSYLWTVPEGVTITEDLGTSIKVTFGTDFVTSAIVVRSANGCGASGARSITINRSLPSIPSLIAGPNNTCILIPSTGNASGTNGIYIVKRTAADLVYVWTVPEGAEIVSNTVGTTEDQIEVKFTNAYVAGDITVVAQNNCGTSSPRVFKLTKLIPGTPGLISENMTGDCPNRIFEYSLVATPSGSVYVEWTVPAGGTILSGQGTTTITVSYDNVAIAGNISVVGINGCRTSGARVLAVKYAACPLGFITKTSTFNSGVELEVLGASIFPNPSTSAFRLKVSSSAKGSIQVNIYDVTGSKRQVLKISAGEVTTFGENLKAGVYMVEVIQGNERKVSRIVKL